MARTKAIEADLSGRVAVVTGANSGIGKEIARGLARLGATVILACRSVERGEAAAAEIRRELPEAALEVRPLDVVDFGSVERFAAGLDRVDILVNNAGAWFGKRTETPDGVEATWATNVLGPFSLTLALQPALAAARGRVVNVGSHLASGLDLGDVEYHQRRYRGFEGAYPESKQALLMLSWEMSRRLAADGITVNVAEPEWTRTACHKHAGALRRFVMNTAGSLFARTPAEGADTAVWLAASPEVANATGGDYLDRQLQPRRFADDAEALDDLWKLCGGYLQKERKPCSTPSPPCVSSPSAPSPCPPPTATAR
jgi:NAD(P)-dependent dehydrogenase (short-subunit alcohol dehydrogenase family)